MRLVLGLCVCMVLLVVGCIDESSYATPQPVGFSECSGIVVVDGCEYFKVKAYFSNTYTHKGNCKNPIHYCKCPVKKGK